VTEVTVSPGFFETIGLPALHGRTFNRDESRQRGADLVVLSFEL
jgi:hypothetical protein